MRSDYSEVGVVRYVLYTCVLLEWRPSVLQPIDKMRTSGSEDMRSMTQDGCFSLQGGGSMAKMIDFRTKMVGVGQRIVAFVAKAMVVRGEGGGLIIRMIAFLTWW